MFQLFTSAFLDTLIHGSVLAIAYGTLMQHPGTLSFGLGMYIIFLYCKVDAAMMSNYIPIESIEYAVWVIKPLVFLMTIAIFYGIGAVMPSWF